MDYEFYDTNVIIYLLDQFAKDRVKLLDFISGKNILISNMVLGEIRNSHSRNDELVELSHNSNLYIISSDKLADEECINWRTRGISEWFSPAKCEEWLIKFLKDGYGDYIPPADLDTKETLYRNYGGKIRHSIGDMAEEKRLRASLSVKIWQRARNCGIDLPITQVTYAKFPSQFVFDYVWWFRYSRQNSERQPPLVRSNDIYDLLNSALAPYVRSWVGERSMVSTLRQVQGRVPPTNKAAFKYMINSNSRNTQFLKEKIRESALIPESLPMLLDTSLLTVTEFEKHYENWAG